MALRCLLPPRPPLPLAMANLPQAVGVTRTATVNGHGVAMANSVQSPGTVCHTRASDIGTAPMNKHGVVTANAAQPLFHIFAIFRRTVRIQGAREHALCVRW
jgi:hypothetical protein